MSPIAYVILSAVLFAIGTTGVLVRRNAIMIFMSVELMLNAANLAFVAFANQLGQLDGQMFVFFVLLILLHDRRLPFRRVQVRLPRALRTHGGQRDQLFSRQIHSNRSLRAYLFRGNRHQATHAVARYA